MDSATKMAAVRTVGLSLRGERGWVYRDVSLEVPPGGVTALCGAAGSGRTALLLTLGGRMRFTSGSASVFDHRLPHDLRAVQHLAALGTVSGVNDLESALTVEEQMGEALDLHLGLLGPFRPKVRRRRIEAALQNVGLDVSPDRPVWDLGPSDAQLLGAAMALVGEPKLLLMDDVGAGSAADAQRALWARLLDIAASSGVTIVGTCHDPEPPTTAQVTHLEMLPEKVEAR